MKILLLAGEESGLIYARALRARLGADEVRGYGDYGFETADLAVVGIWAVLRRIGYFLRVARTMKRAIDDWRPDVVFTIDYPGMNLKLAAYAKERGIRAVHVVCPQVWAWKQGRIPKIERSLDALCCFFPFEPTLFKPGFATFVGHPLVGEFARTRDARRETGAAGHATGDARPAAQGARQEELDAKMTVALLPGSRRNEISYNLPPLLEAAEIVAKAHPDVRFVIPAAHAAAEKQIASIVHLHRSSLPSFSIRLGGAREALLAARCAAVASGTATLEAALAKCPTVLVYRVSALLAWVARRVIRGTRFLGLANILWDRCGGMDREGYGRMPHQRAEAEPPMPELLQEDFTPAAVAERLIGWLDDPSAHASAVRRLTAATDLLQAGTDPLSRILEVACPSSGAAIAS